MPRRIEVTPTLAWAVVNRATGTVRCVTMTKRDALRSGSRPYGELAEHEAVRRALVLPARYSGAVAPNWDISKET